jgi:hypothetical protein
MPPKVASSTAACTASTNVVKSTKIYTMIIDEHIADRCRCPFDSTMVDVIAQHGWEGLSNVTTLNLNEVSGISLLKDDGT